MSNKSEPCRWTIPNDTYDGDVYEPECGADPWEFNDGGPVENKMRFCPFCGRRLKQTKARER